MNSVKMIRNNRLTVSIAKPDKYDFTQRFDRHGFITQVTLDGKDSFCTKEPEGCTNGVGICNEFNMTNPIGYDEAKPGDKFLKLGVGLLTRKDENPYEFWGKYEVEPSVYKCEWKEDKVSFQVKPTLCNGYEVLLNKEITLKDNCINIKYSLENLGEKPVSIEEYCHNFLRFNDYKVCDDYQLYLPYKVQPIEKTEGIVINDEGITWNSDISDGFYMKTSLLDKSYYRAFELKHGPSGLSIIEEDDFYATRFALWGTKDIISPEVFISFTILPGEIKSFSRSFKFSRSLVGI